MLYINGLVSVFIKCVYSFSSDSSTPPTPHPPLKRGWHHSCTSFNCHTSHDCWTTPATQEPHVYSNPTHPRPRWQICRKLEAWAALNMPIILDIVAGNKALLGRLFSECELWTRADVNKSEKRQLLLSFPCSSKRSAVPVDEHSAPSWWWTQQLMKIELLELKSNV